MKFIDFFAGEWNWRGMNALVFANSINLLLRVTSQCTY